MDYIILFILFIGKMIAIWVLPPIVIGIIILFANKLLILISRGKINPLKKVIILWQALMIACEQ